MLYFIDKIKNDSVIKLFSLASQVIVKRNKMAI